LAQAAIRQSVTNAGMANAGAAGRAWQDGHGERGQDHVITQSMARADDMPHSTSAPDANFDANRPAATARPAAGPSSLAQALSERLARHPGLTGTALLRDGMDAFAIRALLMRAAERTLDVQYYIWHDDLTGTLLLEELREAADRGVCVRLLLDDNGIAGLDDVLRSLAEHPNIDVRLFNPFRHRRFKPLDFLFDFSRANRRMHSKSFTADGQVTIVGGRNVGDEYFAAREGGLFADLDAMCIGPVVDQVAACFEAFWTSGSARDIRALVRAPAPGVEASLAERRRRRLAGERAQSYRDAVRELPFIHEIEAQKLAFTWARVELVSDAPEKVLASGSGEPKMVDALVDVIGEPDSELLIVSGYFVPTAAGADAFARMARQGLDIRVLTNSYASTDVGVVHAGYIRYRKQLVEAGVRLYEMPSPGDAPKTARKFVRAGSRKALGRPGSTLHAKAFTVDGKRLFVGSFNFDPRSVSLNTELGIVIASEDLAEAMRAAFDDAIGAGTYRLVVADDGGLGWIDQRDDDPAVERTEPGTSIWSRGIVRVLARLPIEWLL
jgi:putative cardiolipin synthase|tara:strand:- start:1022 stop:2683 length:1662 start_codon:yes stop_codon:yes gene_type:complete